MIESTERITRVTTSSNSHTVQWEEGAGGSQVRVPNGVRITLEFSRSVPLPPGQEMRWRYAISGDGRFQDCVGIPQPTHVVARRGHLVLFHYRLSQWISSAVTRAPLAAAPAVDRSPA